MMLVAYRWSGVKSIVASELTRREAVAKVTAITEAKRLAGWTVQRHSPTKIEVTADWDAGNGGVWVTRPDDWPVTSGEPV